VKADFGMLGFLLFVAMMALHATTDNSHGAGVNRCMKSEYHALLNALVISIYLMPGALGLLKGVQTSKLANGKTPE
jgi:hypothetical protein